jgi:GrpB-like predicted nucleotidyltransferase (UPF0157 family)
MNNNDQLKHLEEQFLDPKFRHSAILVDNLLAEDFIEFSSLGYINSKLEILKSLGVKFPRKSKLRNFNLKPLASNLALVTYIAVEYNEANIEELSTLRSSIWQYANGLWKMLFHQSTPIKDQIVLEKYDKNWPAKALAEINLIKEKCNFNWIKDIQHFGSTAVVGLISKPIIDIMIGVEDIHEAISLVPILESLGYLFWQENPNSDRLFFVKGMPPFAKQRTHHVHVFTINSYEWKARKAFRDYLNTHELARISYETLKSDLAKKFPEDRESYTLAKTHFVTMIVEKALAEGY